MRAFIRLAAGVCAVLAVVLSAAAAPPQITKLSVSTLQVGGTTTLIIDGTDLEPNPRIILPVPIAEQKVKTGGTAKKLQIELKLADNVPSGVYQLRLANDQGISSPINVELDAMPQQPFAAQVAKLPACLQGTLAGSATLSTTVAGKKGQRLVIEVEARRLGSAIEPVIRLLDPQRVQAGLGTRQQSAGRRRPNCGDAADRWLLHHRAARRPVQSRDAQSLPSAPGRLPLCRPALSAGRPARHQGVVPADR